MNIFRAPRGNTTHIANAYSEEVHVRVTREKQYLEEAGGGGGVTGGFEGVNIGVQGSGNAKYSYRKIDPGASIIAPGEFLAYPGEGFYLSVWLPDGKCTAENFRVGTDRSYIIC